MFLIRNGGGDVDGRFHIRAAMEENLPLRIGWNKGFQGWTGLLQTDGWLVDNATTGLVVLASNCCMTAAVVA